MSGRTAQLQIRVTPSEKATLKRLAASVGQNVSTYVLSRALPSADRDLSRILDELRTATEPMVALGSLARFLGDLDSEDLESALSDVSLSGLSALTQNRVAGLIEDVAAARGVAPPPWAAGVPPLTRPHFRWGLASLRAHQLRATRVAYRRRNVFDPFMEAPRSRVPPAATPELAQIHDHLVILELDVEFYFIGGAVFRQVLPVRLDSARPSRLLSASGPAGADPVGDFATQRGWAPTRLTEAVRSVVGQGGSPGRFLELPNLKVFSPPPDYALTMRLATLGPDPSPKVLDDLRLLLRLLDVSTAEEAADITGRYLPLRHLPPRAIDTVRAILG
jgi:hypothetical protein